MGAWETWRMGIPHSQIFEFLRIPNILYRESYHLALGCLTLRMEISENEEIWEKGNYGTGELGDGRIMELENG